MADWEELKLKRVTILGATGSIGTQTLDVISQNSDDFEVVALTASESVEKMAELIQRFCPSYAVMKNEEKAEELRKLLPNHSCEILYGMDGFVAVSTLPNVDVVVAGLKAADFLHDQVARVSTNKVFPIPNRGKKVVLMDFGAKLGIVRELSKRGCDLVIVPYDTPASTILSYRPDGVMLSNGPGDPTDVKVAIETIKELIPQTVVFGICLGHQLISLACGAKTYKLKFGHRGANHPVVNLSTGKVEITSQNHGFAVDIDSLKDTRLEMTHQALNDKSCEGVRHKDYPCFAVQYHPEASAGPEDSRYLFDQFIELMEENKNA